MTPLLGTKTSSAPVGAKLGGERRAARSLLSCALWRGMGRLWRGMGGMGRPEPLSAHRPHQQQGLSGFHGSRDTRHGYCQARRASRREFRGFHYPLVTSHYPRLLCFSRDTKHESRITAFMPCRQTGDARRRAGRRASEGDLRSAGKRMERSFSESRDRNNDLYRIRIRFKIRYSPLFVGIRRKDSDKPLPPIKRPRALRQPRHRLHGCIASPPDLPWPAGLAKWRGEGRMCHESRNAAFDQARGASQPEFQGFHETRDTKHESRLFFETRL